MIAATPPTKIGDIIGALLTENGAYHFAGLSTASGIDYHSRGNFGIRMRGTVGTEMDVKPQKALAGGLPGLFAFTPNHKGKEISTHGPTECTAIGV